MNITKGMNIEEIMGEEKGKLHREKCKLREASYSEEKKKVIREEISKSKSIDKNLIIKKTQSRIKRYGIPCKKDWGTYMRNICNEDTLRNRFGSTDKFAEECGFEWKKTKFIVNNKELQQERRKRTLENRTEEEVKEWRNKISKSRTISKEFIKSKALERVQKYGSFCKSEWQRFMSDICNEETIRNKFDSKDKFAEECGFEWKKAPNGLNDVQIGINETIILDSIEKEKDIKLDRQSQVGVYYIDGYDENNNIAYEVDEPAHFKEKQFLKDREREEFIKNKIGCKFIRINEKEFLKGEINGK